MLHLAFLGLPLWQCSGEFSVQHPDACPTACVCMLKHPLHPSICASHKLSSSRSQHQCRSCVLEQAGYAYPAATEALKGGVQAVSCTGPFACNFTAAASTRASEVGIMHPASSKAISVYIVSATSFESHERVVRVHACMLPRQACWLVTDDLPLHCKCQQAGSSAVATACSHDPYQVSYLLVLFSLPAIVCHTCNQQ